jgi:predicted RNA binding protein YcfA (HicA-like mRNA interferase family)
MPRGKFNWTFKDIERFLKANGFVLHHVRGSHHYYRGFIDGQLRMTHVEYHGSGSIPPKTLESIIKQSGIPKDDWLN